MPRSSPRPTSLASAAWGLGALALAVAVAASLHGAARFYKGFRLPSAFEGGVPTEELAFEVQYLVYGLGFVGLLAAGLRLTGLAGPLLRGLRHAHRERPVPALLVALGGLVALGVRVVVLQRQPIVDAEQVTAFIARTLLAGRLVNPLPPEPSFFHHPLLVLDGHGWYGAASPGHPLLLALALLAHLEDLVPPLLALVTLVVTWRAGRLALGPRRALVGLALLALSPHFAWSHGTWLVEVTTTCTTAVAVWLGLRWRRDGGSLAALGLGAALGWGVFTLVGSGLLVAGAVGAAVACARERPWAQRTGALAVLGAGVGLGLGGLALVHLAQSGSAFGGEAEVVHAAFQGAVGGPEAVGQALFAALWRENVWLFGWPLSLLPVAFARPRRGRWFLWLPVAALVLGRLLSPSTGPSTTGPVSLLPVVPLLALLGADGLGRLRRRAAAAPLLAFAGSVAMVTCFAPLELQAIGSGAATRRVVWDLLEEQHPGPALVFADLLVERRAMATWALSVPPPSPRLDDEVLFLRWPELGPRAPARQRLRVALDFARRRFPGRQALAFLPDVDGPELLTLEKALAELGTPTRARRARPPVELPP